MIVLPSSGYGLAAGDMVSIAARHDAAQSFAPF